MARGIVTGQSPIIVNGWVSNNVLSQCCKDFHVKTNVNFLPIKTANDHGLLFGFAHWCFMGAWGWEGMCKWPLVFRIVLKQPRFFSGHYTIRKVGALIPVDLLLTRGTNFPHSFHMAKFLVTISKTVDWGMLKSSGIILIPHHFVTHQQCSVNFWVSCLPKGSRSGRHLSLCLYSLGAAWVTQKRPIYVWQMIYQSTSLDPDILVTLLTQVFSKNFLESGISETATYTIQMCS